MILREKSVDIYILLVNIKIIKENEYIYRFIIINKKNVTNNTVPRIFQLRLNRAKKLHIPISAIIKEVYEKFSAIS